MSYKTLKIKRCALKPQLLIVTKCTDLYCLKNSTYLAFKNLNYHHKTNTITEQSFIFVVIRRLPFIFWDLASLVLQSAN